MARLPYDSDITREQFTKISHFLVDCSKITKPRHVDLYDVFCAILYLSKTGCQWRYLPHDFPKWRTVYSYFQIWSTSLIGQQSVFSLMLEAIVRDIRKKDERNEKTTFIIIDSQSVKNTDTAEEKGYDGGKKVSGIKRTLAVDTQGLPHAIVVTTADVNDRDAALQAFENNKSNLSNVIAVLTDGGYTGEKFATKTKELLNAKVQVAQRSELHKFKVIPQRWVVERSFSWLEKCRRLWKNCERKLNTSLQFVNLAYIALLIKRS